MSTYTTSGGGEGRWITRKFQKGRRRAGVRTSGFTVAKRLEEKENDLSLSPHKNIQPRSTKTEERCST